MNHLFVILNAVMNLFSTYSTRSFAMLRMTSSFFCSIILLSSCSELLYLNIEQMVPPEVMPEQTARSVGVVSNFSEHNVLVVNENAVILPCDADSVKEQIAQTFANAGFIKRVVVLDSLLYHPDSTSTHVFTQAEINELCKELDVEMIYSVDYACLVYNPASRFISRPLNAYLCSRIYIPDSDSIRGTSVMDKETLDYWVNDADEISHLAPQIPHLLAEAAIKPYLPSWAERERLFYHDQLSYALREASLYVKEGNWEAAASHWRPLTTSRLRAYRFMAAYNLALYYEMTDDIDAALRMLDQAEKEIASTLIEKYREVLIHRQKELEQLKEWEMRNL